MTRRGFLKGIAAAGASLAVPTLIPSTVLGRDGAVAPSNRVAMGFIGTGSQGVGMNLRTFLTQGDCQVAAVCDVDPKHMAKALDTVKSYYGAKHSGCAATKDWREVIARNDIDAVMISTPDHWHAPMSIAAARTGKDVICEKPTMTVAEGRVLADIVKRYGTIFQFATEDRSVGCYHRMAELVRNGRIGKLHTIRVELPGGPDLPGNPTPQPVPEGFDYDTWLGPAPWAPYTKDRCHYNFRWIRDYSGGQLTDWGTHLLDTAQWANDTEHTGPVEVEGAGICYEDGLYDVAHTFHVEYKYAGGVRMIVDSGGAEMRFEGDLGWVGNRGWKARVEASSPKILMSIIGPEETHLFKGNGQQRNFLDCIHTRKDPYFPAEIGHRCCTLTHLGNIAIDLGRKLRWDPDKEEFPNDPQANRLRSRSMRSPWTL